MSMGGAAALSARTCALTGASGYVGSFLRRGLESAGWTVIPLSRQASKETDGIRWSLDAVSSTLRHEFQRRNVSALVHAAWDLDLVRPSDLDRVNVQGSLRLLAEAEAGGVERCVFISTISAYPEARSHYGRTKLAVERAVQSLGGVVIRPGLVFPDPPTRPHEAEKREGRGMFAALARQASRSRVIPLIGKGSDPQYLVRESDLSAAVERACVMESVPRGPVTVAHSRPWTLRALLQEMAQAKGRSVRFLPVPWQAIYSGLRVAEELGMRLGFRSDSVISMVYQNPGPDLNAELLGVEPRPFRSRQSKSTDAVR